MSLQDGNDVVLDDGTPGGVEKKDTSSSDAQRIRNAELQALKAQVYAEVLQDPDLMAVMQAKKSGRSVKIIPLSMDGSDPTEKKVVDPPETLQALDFESATPKDIHAHTIKSVEVMLKKMIPEMIQKSIEPMNQRIEGITGVVRSSAEEKIATEVKRLSVKYKDFNDFIDSMSKIQASNPGLSIEELYGVAKARAGSPIETQRTSSERPSTQTTARPVRREENGERRPSQVAVTNRLDFRSLLEKAAIKSINSVDTERDAMFENTE
jgi:hypothetical protein